MRAVRSLRIYAGELSQDDHVSGLSTLAFVVSDGFLLAIYGILVSFPSLISLFQHTHHISARGHPHLCGW